MTRIARSRHCWVHVVVVAYVDHVRSPIAGVQILEDMVDTPMSNDLPNRRLPCHLAQLDVAITTEQKDTSADALRGAYPRLTACELAHVALKRCFLDLTKKNCRSADP